MIFLHELAHVRRKDVLLNYLLVGVQFLHWFNPLVWLALHRLRADRELVCDAMAMQRLGAEERLAYGNVLLKLMEGFSPEFRGFSGAVPVISSLAEIKRRIVMIKNHRTASLAVCLTMALLVLALALVAFTHAPGPGATRHVSGEDLVLPGGPSYHGQSLGHWTCQLKQGNLQGQAEAREALRTLATNAVPTLVGWLRTAPPQWSGYAATALGELGPSASNAIPALESIASGPPSPPRNAAVAAALMKIKGEPIDGLIRALDNPDSGLVGTAQILAEFGTNASPAIPALCRALDSDKGWAAAYAIGFIHSQPEIAVPALIAAINQEDAKGERNKNSMNNLNRIWALGEFESEASLAIPILRQHLNDSEPMIRQSALGSLRRILPPRQLKTLVPVLVQNARDSDPNLSVVARSLLLEIDPMAARKVAIQMAIQDGADKFYRKWVLRLRE
jgi:HEAT repeat protein